MHPSCDNKRLFLPVAECLGQGPQSEQEQEQSLGVEGTKKAHLQEALWVQGEVQEKAAGSVGALAVAVQIWGRVSGIQQGRSKEVELALRSLQEAG